MALKQVSKTVATWAVVAVVLMGWNPARAQDSQTLGETEPTLNITVGAQAGVGLSGQLALGGRFFILREHQGLGSGLGISFLVGSQNIFVPSRVNVVKVSGATLFTEILFRLRLDPITLQSAMGMAIVKREGRTKRGLPVQLASQGPYLGVDARYPLDENLSLYAGLRFAFLHNAILTITGIREVVPVETQPAVFAGVSWDF